jgi:hypothetical protein
VNLGHPPDPHRGVGLADVALEAGGDAVVAGGGAAFGLGPYVVNGGGVGSAIGALVIPGGKD